MLAFSVVNLSVCLRPCLLSEALKKENKIMATTSQDRNPFSKRRLVGVVVVIYRSWIVRGIFEYRIGMFELFKK